jgi:hypothetical protein
MSCRVIVQTRLPLSPVVVSVVEPPTPALVQTRLPLSPVVVPTRATQGTLATEGGLFIVTELGAQIVVEVCFG